MFTKQAFVVLLLALLSPVIGMGEILTIDVVYEGVINNTPLAAHATGTIDTTGSTPSSVSLAFTAVPADFHPAVMGNSGTTFFCPNSYLESNGSQNLFSLAGGNYAVERLFDWPDFPNSFLLASTSITTSQGILSGTITIDGVYSGPTDLIDGDENYALAWLPSGPNALIEGGISHMITSSGQRHAVNFASRFSELSVPLNMPQIAAVDFKWTFDNNIYDVAWTGSMTVVPEPASLLLLAVGALSALTRRIRHSV